MPFDFLKRKKEPKPQAATAAQAAASEPAGIPFDGLTEDWRLVGRMLIDGRLSDALNRREPISITDVRWAPVDGSGPLVPAPGLKTVDPYDLVIVLAGDATLPEMDDDERSAHRVHKVSYEVALEVPPYRVVGTVFLYPGSEPDSLLNRSSDMFVPVVERDRVDGRPGRSGTGRPMRSWSIEPTCAASSRSMCGRANATRSCRARRWAGELDRPHLTSERGAAEAAQARAAACLERRTGSRLRRLGPGFGTPSTRSASRSKSARDLLLGEHLDDRPTLVRGAHEEQPAGPDQGQGRHADRPLHVLDGDPAVGTVDDHRQPLATAETARHVAQLDGGADGGHVRGDRHEDPVGLVEDRLVERAVRRVQVDDDDVDPRARGGDGGRHPGRVEDVGVERRIGQGDDLHPGHVLRGDLVEGLARAALGLVAPAVGDGPDGVDGRARS